MNIAISDKRSVVLASFSDNM